MNPIQPGPSQYERIILELDQPVEIGSGITLPPGTYVCRKGRNHMGAQYLVELTADEVRGLGGEPSAEMAVYDVSKFVRQGKINVPRSPG